MLLSTVRGSPAPTNSVPWAAGPLCDCFGHQHFLFSFWHRLRRQRPGHLGPLGHQEDAVKVTVPLRQRRGGGREGERRKRRQRGPALKPLRVRPSRCSDGSKASALYPVPRPHVSATEGTTEAQECGPSLQQACAPALPVPCARPAEPALDSQTVSSPGSQLSPGRFCHFCRRGRKTIKPWLPSWSTGRFQKAESRGEGLEEGGALACGGSLSATWTLNK